MAENIIWILGITALLLLGLVLVVSRCVKRAGNHHYSLLAIIQAVIYMGLSIWMASLNYPAMVIFIWIRWLFLKY